MRPEDTALAGGVDEDEQPTLVELLERFAEEIQGFSHFKFNAYGNEIAERYAVRIASLFEQSQPQRGEAK